MGINNSVHHKFPDPCSHPSQIFQVASEEGRQERQHVRRMILIDFVEDFIEEADHLNELGVPRFLEGLRAEESKEGIGRGLVDELLQFWDPSALSCAFCVELF